MSGFNPPLKQTGNYTCVFSALAKQISHTCFDVLASIIGKYTCFRRCKYITTRVFLTFGRASGYSYKYMPMCVLNVLAQQVDKYAHAFKVLSKQICRYVCVF